MDIPGGGQSLCEGPEVGGVINGKKKRPERLRNSQPQAESSEMGEKRAEIRTFIGLFFLCF